jgi:ABC-2 type transport system permease protein
MKVLITLVKRELQEHKVGLIYAPFIVAIILSLVIVLVYFGVADIKANDINFSTSVYENGEAVEWMRAATVDQKVAVIRSGLIVLGFPVAFVMIFAVLSYSLGTFFEERKDKSIIFWRSLPISDLETVLSKVFVVVFIAPLIILPALIFLHMVSLLSASIFFAVSDIVPFTWIWNAYSITDWFRIIFSLWTQLLWSLPILAWLMLAGAYSRKPIVAAILPLVGIIAIERVVFGSAVFLATAIERIQPWSLMSSFPKQYEELRVVEIADIPLLLATQEFWYGMLISILLIGAIVYIRSRSEYSSVE